MSQVIDIFTIDSLQINETVFRASDSSPSIDDNHSTLSSSSQSDILLTQISNSSPTPYWRPSERFQKVLRILHEDDYAQFPCVLCSYCSRLLYPLSANWVTRDNNIVYPLETSFPETNLTNNPRNSQKLQFAMDVNQILITEYASAYSMYSQRTIRKKKISVSHLSTHQFRSICWNSRLVGVNKTIFKQNRISINLVHYESSP